MSQQAGVPKQLFESPELYLVEYMANQALFSQMTRETYGNSIFMDRYRIQAARTEPVVIAVSGLLNACKSYHVDQAPIDLVVHPANCGSTLFSRALDRPGRNIVYREPFTLRQLGVEYSRPFTGADEKQSWQDRLMLSLLLLGRTYSGSEKSIVKTNIPINFMLPEMLQRLPRPRGIILYSDLRSFLISALKSPQRRQWVIQVSAEMAGAIGSMDALSGIGTADLPLAKVAALLWIAQYFKYVDVLEAHENFRSLKSTVFYENPRGTLAAAFEHFETTMTGQEIDNIVGGELFKRYSKDPRVHYSAEIRKADEQRLEKELHEELQQALDWGDSLLDQYGMSGSLKKPLVI